MKHYLDSSESPEVDIEEMKPYLLGLNEFEVDIRYIALHAGGERDFLVVTVASWDEHERMRVIHEQKSKSSAKRSNKSGKGKSCLWL